MATPTPTSTSTPEQERVHESHNNPHLVSEAEKIVMKETGGDVKFMSQFCISTTTHSQALIVIAGYKDELPYNPYSKEKTNPWLITGYPQISKPEFFTQLKGYWENILKAPADWTICPFRVYEGSGNEWVALEDEALKVDTENKVVRVKVSDQTFWCHPPRPFKVLENVCGNDYKQKKGNLKTCLTSFQKGDTDSQTKLKASFNKLYELVNNLDWNDPKQLTSYRYPSFQMEIYTTYTDQTAPDQTAPDQTAPDQTAPDRTAPDQTAPDQTAPDQRPRGTIRFGNDSSGVYPVNSNEAHYAFAVKGTEPTPKPTKKVLWNWVMKSLDENNPLPYERVFEEEETDN